MHSPSQRVPAVRLGLSSEVFICSFNNMGYAGNTVKWVSTFGLSNNNKWWLDVDGFCQLLSADSQPKSDGLVWGLPANRRFICIHQMNRVMSHKVSEPWWQHHKYGQGIIIIISARCNTSRAYATMSVSVCLSVTEVHWRIIANLGFKFRSHFTAHCGHRAACGRIISRHASQC